MFWSESVYRWFENCQIYFLHLKPIDLISTSVYEAAIELERT